jgi:hypothetical protein
MANDLIVNLWSIVFRKPREYIRGLEHVDVIVRTYHAEERMANP